MRLHAGLPVTVAAAIGLFLLGTNAHGVVEANAAGRNAEVSASTATQRVKLGLNKSVVIDLPSDAYDILVANPAVADAVTRTARRIYLFGKAVGDTNIFVFGPNGEQIVSLDLAVERDVAGLEDYIRRFIPSSAITVELLNDNVVLTGTVDTPWTPSVRSIWPRSSCPAVKRPRDNIRRPPPAARPKPVSTSTIRIPSAASARSSTCCRSSATTR